MSKRSFYSLLSVAVVGALLATLIFPISLFAHEPGDTGIEDFHDTNMEGNPATVAHIHYAENGMDPVREFASKDPEGARIEWNVRGVDAADFEMSSTGVLTFKESPDYENPTDRARDALDLNDDGVTDDPGEAAMAADDRNYQITVSATEMRAGASAPLPAKRTDIALTVIVGNVDDPGELNLQWLQPEVTTAIGTTLTDPDGETSSPTWAWYTSKAADPVVGNMFHWTVVDGQTGTSYTPVEADEGKYLWVNVAYTDPEGDTKTADAKSENPVRAAVSDLANASPDFEDNTDTRTVPEDTAVDDPVGDPVTATDTDSDILTYELDDDATSDNELADDSDLQFFNIDMETGQNRGGARAGLRRGWRRSRSQRRGWNVHGRRQGDGPFRRGGQYHGHHQGGKRERSPDSDRTGGAQRR